ncbi:DUF502 domain-containing protein [Acidobacteria bacterium ACD]|nr:MAG: DUF502 domain-containing protein [Acidobacteriota bacterium]MCE7958538.1 DUF502 domain-containing protein [Acidobacteria bacterium ACB2]MDL1949841.1 DUF502 domain-containing protein [Acidobacteria bacterium ACD]
MQLRIRRHLTAGLLVLVPVVVTAVVVRFLFELVDGTARPAARFLVGREIPGLGLLLTLAVVYLTGLLSANFAGKKLLAVFDRLLENLPVVRTVYTAVKQLVEAVSPGGREAFRRVVLVEFPKKGSWALAFVTGDGIGPSQQRMATVFVPAAINPTSGFVLVVPAGELEDPGLSIEEGLKLVVSGGVVAPGPAAPRAAGAP